MSRYGPRSTNYQPILAGIAIGVIAIRLLVSQGIHASEGDCVPIETLFQQQIVEENLNGENIGGYKTTGALDLWRDNPLRVGSLDGDSVGMSTGKCTLLNGANELMCTGMIKISENDSITFTGLSPNNDDANKLAITGGTGCYKESKGSISISYRDEKSLLYTYEPGVSNNKCIPIDRLVGDGLKEVNTMNHWAGNALTNSKGDQVGKSYGFCDRLPGSTRQFCVGEWVLDGSSDIITFSGHFPSRTDEGVLAVTGGTGCYDGVSATLSLSLIFAHDDWNLFSYGIKSTTQDITLTLRMKELEAQQLTW